ncbi:non-homologous end-joining DNA ligase [Pengzhenrongella sicca]|uniref:Non-homologous end-joining DNA ligase n=2 Tax=Pengzhenrongella sicca TaxID=2819238 RepID=A0A8A4ZKA0_9MICO|nr:non-homologous end-joining DNA ligase [Pengzhenrongella sicca]
MYPAVGMTKAEVIDYYARVADAILPQLKDRPVTRIRFPDGVAGQQFFEKNVPAGAPDWVRRQRLAASPGAEDEGTMLTLPFLDDLPSLVWSANQGALELHTPQWRVGPRGGLRNPDRLVIDLDPGAPAALHDCARVAHLVADRLRADGLEPVPVTSGSKGLQLYAPLRGRRTVLEVRQYARDLAHELAAEHPRQIVALMTKNLRGGKVLLDWSQNHPAKTTITPYSLRGRDRPTVAAPRTWAELDDDELRQLTPDEVLDRLADIGDLLAPGR